MIGLLKAQGGVILAVPIGVLYAVVAYIRRTLEW